jgi:hypothetical protein
MTLRHTSPSILEKLFPHLLTTGSHKAKLRLEAAVTAELAKCKENQVRATWNKCIEELGKGIDYRENRTTATSLLLTYGYACHLSEAQLKEAAERGEKMMHYNTMKDYVLGGNTALSESYKEAAKAIGATDEEIRETLKTGALKEGAGYAAEIARGNPVPESRLERLVGFGLPKNYVKKALVVCMINSLAAYRLVKEHDAQSVQDPFLNSVKYKLPDKMTSTKS